MKNIFFSLIAASLMLISCKKNEASPENKETTEAAKSNEISLEQDVKILKSSKGDQLKVTYFAEGTDVAVKIQKNEEPEQKLSAKTVSEKGNPIFTNDTYMWEMNDSGTGGKLSDKDGNAMVYTVE